MKQERDRAIRIFLGDDTKRAREALERAIDDMRANNAPALVSRFDDVSFDPVLLREALVSQSIFGGENIVVIDGILDHEDGAEFYRSMPGWKDNINFVFIRETAPSKEIRSLFKGIGMIEEFLGRKIFEKKKDFALADAVAMRDKRSAWVHFTREDRSGMAMEEMHGMIFWAIKALYLCATEAKEEALKAGVKEYTYRTYKPRAKNFLPGELEKKLGELKDMYHRAHQGEGDLGVYLEQFVLKL